MTNEMYFLLTHLEKAFQICIISFKKILEKFQFHFGIPMKIYVYKTTMNPNVSFSHLVDFSFQITKEKINDVFEKGGGGGGGFDHFLNNNFLKFYIVTYVLVSF
jgi:hypothetical protein